MSWTFFPWTFFYQWSLSSLCYAKLFFVGLHINLVCYERVWGEFELKRDFRFIKRLRVHSWIFMQRLYSHSKIRPNYPPNPPPPPRVSKTFNSIIANFISFIFNFFSFAPLPPFFYLFLYVFFLLSPLICRLGYANQPQGGQFKPGHTIQNNLLEINIFLLMSSMLY